MEVKLTLTTKRDIRKIKGFDSTAGAIVDADNNLVCVVPLVYMDWVFDCLTAKTRTDKLFTILSKMTDEEPRLCAGCRKTQDKTRDWRSESRRDFPDTKRLA